jgi:2-dehydro-3-deoxygalactonokinase
MRGAWIGVDWGTSNLRAWKFSETGEVIGARACNAGISSIVEHRFSTALVETVGAWTDGSLPILLGGMIGSRQGWAEVPYLPCPAKPTDLAAHAYPIDTGIGRGWIVPGLSCFDESGVADVMRGEEVQLLGAEIENGLALMPGTHSKWVTIVQGAVMSFRTFMTGELFALLKERSLLGRLMIDGPDDYSAFDEGLDRAFADPALTSLLFGVRTEGLFGRLAPEALADYLSGLLIGAELAGMRCHRGIPLTLIGEGALAARYDRALRRAGSTHVATLAGDEAAIRGLRKIAGIVLEGK